MIFVRHILSVLGPAAVAGVPSEWGIRFAVIFYIWSLIKKRRSRLNAIHIKRISEA